MSRRGISCIHSSHLEANARQERRAHLHETERKNANNHELLLLPHLKVIHDPCWQHQHKDISQDGNTRCPSDEISKVEALGIGVGRGVPIRLNWETMKYCEEEGHDHHNRVEYQKTPYRPTHG